MGGVANSNRIICLHSGEKRTLDARKYSNAQLGRQIHRTGDILFNQYSVHQESKERSIDASTVTDSSSTPTAWPLCFLCSFLLTFCLAATPSTCIPFTVANGTHKERDLNEL